MVKLETRNSKQEIANGAFDRLETLVKICEVFRDVWDELVSASNLSIMSRGINTYLPERSQI